MLIDTYQLLQKVRKLDQRLHHLPFKVYASVTGNDLFHINLDISGECNLRCNMCSLARWYPKDMSKTVSLDTIDKLVPVFEKLKSISLICNTEPLLNPDVFTIIGKIRAANPSALITFTTNATLMTPEIAAQIIEHRVDKVGISIDAVTPELFEEIRVGAKFDEVIANTEELIRQKLAAKSELPKLEMVFVAMKKNIHELVPAMEMAQRMGFDSVVVNGLDPYAKGMADEALWSTEPAPEHVRAFEDARAAARRLGLELTLPSLKLEGFQTCNLANAVIDPDGNVSPCSILSYQRPYFYKGEKLMRPRVVYGNVNEKPFWEIWNDPEYKGFRDRLRNGDLPDMCKTCLMKNEVICPN